MRVVGLARGRIPPILALLAIAPIASALGCGEEPQVEPEVTRPIKILELDGSGAGRVREFPGQVSAA